MKIAYFIPVYHTQGGRERVLIEKANYLAEKFNFDVSIVSFRNKTNNTFYPVSPKVKCVYLDIEIPPYKTFLSYGFWKRRNTFIALNKRYKYCVEEFLLNNKIDISISLFDKEIEFLHKIKDSSKKVVELHDCFGSEVLNLFNLESIKTYYNKLRFKRILSKYDKVIFLVKNSYNDWKGLSNKEIIPNPITITSDRQAALDNHRVLFLGGLSYRKALDTLIKAWELVSAKYSDWKLDIYGVSEDKTNEVLRLFENKDLVKTVNIYPATKEVSSVLEDVSIHCLTSRREGFSLVILEAMSMGVPTVSMNCKHGPSDLINDGEDGFLVEPENHNEYADRLSKLMEDKSLRLQFGAKAKEKSKSYGVEIVMNKWKYLFNSLINQQ